MEIVHRALIATVTLAALAVWPAHAQPAPDPAAYVVTYIAVTPSAGTQAADLLRGLAVASRKEAGNLRFDVLRQVDRGNQFAILETWRDGKAFEAHAAGAAMKTFRAALDPLRIGYYDERLETGIDVAPLPATAAAGAIYVITHVDVTGSFKDEAIGMMKKLAADSRRQPGAERYDVWQQNNRLNHFTVTEIWKDAAALDAHDRTAPARDFREQLGHMMGALYDDRHYSNLE
jgi:quinol monooxygenase YgiN